jgi:hypothetical protein
MEGIPVNMELFKEIAAKCNGSVIDGCLIEIESLRQQLTEKDAEILKLAQMYPATAYTLDVEKQA